MLLRRQNRISGLGEEKPAVIDSPFIGEPLKLVGYGVVLYFAYKFLSSTAQKKVTQFKEHLQKRRAKKKMRKAQRLAEKIEDMGFHVRLEDPGLYDRD